MIVQTFSFSTLFEAKHMYGLVNKAVTDLVVSKFGEEKWDEIVEKAGLEDDTFIGMETYDDEITYKMVAAASEVLGLTAAQVLEAFGEHWMVYTGREGYGDLIEMTGGNALEFLENLNRLHSRVRATFSELQPPKFTVFDQKDNQLTLRYESEREGLAPMVVGICRGLGVLFNEKVEATLITHRADAGYDEFRVTAEALEQAA